MKALAVHKLDYNSLEWLLLRDQVKARDNHTCQHCGQFSYEKGNRLEVHHEEYNWKAKNPLIVPIEHLITLCKRCHDAEHERIDNHKHKMDIISLHIDGETIEARKDKKHEMVLTTDQVAKGFGVTSNTITQAKKRNPLDFKEGKHWVMTKRHTLGGPQDVTLWTKAGVIRLGMRIRGTKQNENRVIAFRDLIEDIVIDRLDQAQPKAEAPLFFLNSTRKDQIALNRRTDAKQQMDAWIVTCNVSGISNSRYWTGVLKPLVIKRLEERTGMRLRGDVNLTEIARTHDPDLAMTKHISVGVIDSHGNEYKVSVVEKEVRELVDSVNKLQKMNLLTTSTGFGAQTSMAI